MAIGFPVKDDYVTGDVLTAANMNDLSGTVNTLQSTGYAAGKNKIINGDFGVWQRGTSFTTNGVYTADRFNINRNGSASTVTVSRENFTTGAAPVAGYEGKFFFRFNQTVAGTGATSNVINHPIEDVQTFAGQTMTLSFWAKADAARTITVAPYQIFGSGGSTFVAVATQSITTTTSWARYSLTFSIPSISGKTVGTGSYFLLEFQLPLNTTQTIDLWGMQAENGSTASTFQTATGTIQGELAACQRYYIRYVPQTTGSAGAIFGVSPTMTTTTIADTIFPMPVTMRTNVVSMETNQLGIYRSANATRYESGTFTLTTATEKIAVVRYTHGSGVFTAGETGLFVTGTTATNPYVGLSAEL